MAERLRLIIFGRQGAGKGTQCQRLAASLGIPHISTGDMLRAAASSGSAFGRQVQEIMTRGELVSDEVMEGVVRERLAQPDAANGFLLDGYPRTPAQAEFLQVITAPEGIDLGVVLDVPESVVLDRITRRRVCEQCGTVYNVDDAPARSGVCAKCGGQVVQRTDDTAEAVQRRLADYERQTAPLLEWFAARGKLRVVDGAGPADDVSSALLAAIETEFAG